MAINLCRECASLSPQAIINTTLHGVSGNNYVKQKSRESRIHKYAPPLSSLGLLCYKVLLDSTPIQEGVVIFILIVSTTGIVLTLQG